MEEKKEKCEQRACHNKFQTQLIFSKAQEMFFFVLLAASGGAN